MLPLPSDVGLEAPARAKRRILVCDVVLECTSSVGRVAVAFGVAKERELSPVAALLAAGSRYFQARLFH